MSQPISPVLSVHFLKVWRALASQLHFPNGGKCESFLSESAAVKKLSTSEGNERFS